MASLANASLLAATITTGLTAGLLYTFAHTVMPGLARVDDRTFIGVFQSIDRAIINPWFVAGFLGGPLFTAVAAALHLAGSRGGALAWLLAALALHVVVLAVTMGVNVPLNRRLHAAGPPEVRTDPAAARGGFEARWVRWHAVRTVAAVAAFGCLAVATSQG